MKGRVFMNDFTKEELNELLKLAINASNRLNPNDSDLLCLKIQSIIDNYCERENHGYEELNIIRQYTMDTYLLIKLAIDLINLAEPQEAKKLLQICLDKINGIRNLLP